MPQKKKILIDGNTSDKENGGSTSIHCVWTDADDAILVRVLTEQIAILSQHAVALSCSSHVTSNPSSSGWISHTSTGAVESSVSLADGSSLLHC